MGERSCYLCMGKSFKKRSNSVRDVVGVQVLECDTCGLVFLSSFEHICDGFYEQSGMHDNDIELNVWLAETEWDDQRRVDYLCRLLENRTVLDFGCGNGGFLLKAKQYAAKAEGVELEKRWHHFFKNAGISVYPNISAITTKYDFITMFHTLEHILDPVSLLVELSDKLNDKGQIIVEVPNANDALITLYENDSFKDFTYWGCHLFLFNNHTLRKIGEQAGLRVNYVKQVQRYSLANHLYWLANGEPAGHKKWSFIDSDLLHKEYEKQLASIGCCDTIVASFCKY